VARRKPDHDRSRCTTRCLQPCGAGNGRQEQAEIQVAGCQRSRLLGAKGISRSASANAGRAGLVGFSRPGSTRSRQARRTRSAAATLAGSHAAELGYGGPSCAARRRASSRSARPSAVATPPAGEGAASEQRATPERASRDGACCAADSGAVEICTAAGSERSACLDRRRASMTLAAQLEPP